MDLENFQALPAGQKLQRRELARRELAFVIRWHQKQVANAYGLSTKRWRGKQTDVDLLGAVLEDLNNATGLDPSNPYPWHLLGWLRAQVGDIARSDEAFGKAEQALAEVPPSALVELRRRLLLDQGDSKAGQVALGRALELDPQNGGLLMQLRLLKQ